MKRQFGKEWKRAMKSLEHGKDRSKSKKRKKVRK